MIRCVLFDRDGTLGQLGDDRYPQTLVSYAPVRETFSELKRLGYFVGILSNQSSIARGTGRGYDFEAEFTGYGADVWEICPHDKGEGCACRKPASGMMYAAAEKLGIQTKECILVGDRMSDVLCAENAGAHGVLVLTGYGRAEEAEVREKFPHVPVLERFDEIAAFLQSGAKFGERNEIFGKNGS